MRAKIKQKAKDIQAIPLPSLSEELYSCPVRWSDKLLDLEDKFSFWVVSSSAYHVIPG